MIESTGLDQPDTGRIVKSGRLGAAEALQGRFSDDRRTTLARVPGQVEQHHRDAGVGQMRGNADPHGSCTQYCGLMDHRGARTRGRVGRRCGGAFHRGGGRGAHGSDSSLLNGTLLDPSRKTVSVNME